MQNYSCSYPQLQQYVFEPPPPSAPKEEDIAPPTLSQTSSTTNTEQPCQKRSFIGRFFRWILPSFSTRSHDNVQTMATQINDLQTEVRQLREKLTKEQECANNNYWHYLQTYDQYCREAEKLRISEQTKQENRTEIETLKEQIKQILSSHDCFDKIAQNVLIQKKDNEIRKLERREQKYINQVTTALSTTMQSLEKEDNTLSTCCEVLTKENRQMTQEIHDLTTKLLARDTTLETYITQNSYLWDQIRTKRTREQELISIIFNLQEFLKETLPEEYKEKIDRTVNKLSGSTNSLTK